MPKFEEFCPSQAGETIRWSETDSDQSWVAYKTVSLQRRKFKVLRIGIWRFVSGLGQSAIGVRDDCAYGKKYLLRKSIEQSFGLKTLTKSRLWID